DLLFSPDGTRVAYTDKQLVIQEVDDLDEARASSTQPPGRAVEWASDNSRVAFLRIDENGRPRGIATRADGAYPQDVPAAGGFSLSPSGDRLVSADDRGAAAKVRVTDVATHTDRVVAEGLWQPTWSTRGEDIATLGLVPGTKANFVCVVQGKAQRRVANLPGPPPYGTFEWSPSGTTLAFLTF
nr:hypothetical protein [Actinomycetota bacterium]